MVYPISPTGLTIVGPDVGPTMVRRPRVLDSRPITAVNCIEAAEAKFG